MFSRQAPDGATFLRRLGAWLATPSGLGTLFALGLAIRMVLARGGGFPYDIASFSAWSSRLVEKGPWNFYPAPGENVGFFVDYPPGYLYVLWPLGLLAKALKGAGPPELWIKLPPILADLGLAWLVGLAAERFAPPSESRRLPMRAIGAAAILLNPAIFFISAVWGQADSVLAVLVVGSFLLLGTGVQRFRREAAAMALLALGIGTKPQAVFAVPIVILVLAWRHIRGGMASVDDAHDRRRAGWMGLGRFVALGGVALLTAQAIFAPFGLFPLRAMRFYSSAASTYPNSSIFAFNFWGAVGFWRPDSGPNAYTFLGVSLVWWGIAMFVAFSALILGRAWASLRNGQDEGRVLVFGGLAITLVSFAVLTRVHERYLFLPLGLAAMLVGIRWLRRAFVVLSVLYLVNVYFPWVYYLRTVKRPAITFGRLFDSFYGTDIYGARMRALSAFVGAVCLLIAWRGWRAMEAVAGETDAADGRPGTDSAAEEERPFERPPWSLRLHPVGRRGAAIALAIFLGAFVLRLIGLGHPPGMYFDEVYHARTGAEYLGHKEVFEYTHPPFAKEAIGFAIQHMSGFGSRPGDALPSDVVVSTLTQRPDGVAWAEASPTSSRIVFGQIDANCRPIETSTFSQVNFHADAMTTSANSVYVAGSADGQSDLVRFDGGTEVWRAKLPARAADVAVVSDHAYVLTTNGELVSVSATGEPDTVAVGAGAISASAPDGEVWASFQEQRELAAWDTAGKRTHVIQVKGRPNAVAAHRDGERVFTSIGTGLLAYDIKSETEQAQLEGGADLLGTVPETTLVWAVDGTSVRAIEPHAGVVIGRTTFDRAPDRLFSDPVRHQLVGVADGRVECAYGRPQFAWRFGSVVTGALMVAMVFLLALRLTGSRGAAFLASGFLAIEGLAFTLSRIAMNDSYSTGFVLATWFCAVSALYAWGRARPETEFGEPPRNRAAAIGWLMAAGVVGGLGLASKWPALYALAAIGLLYVWDGFTRRDASIWRVAGPFVPSAAIVAASVVVIPLAIYVATYIPYFTLGHSFSEFLRLQYNMFNYHATLKATHPFGSPWWGWPFGYKAVYFYVHSTGARRAEIWTIQNLAVTWGGLIGMGFLVDRVRRSRSVALALVLVGALVQYLPWIPVSRVTFMYHYLPVVPFLTIAFGWWLAVEMRDQKHQKTAIAVACGTAVAMFVFIYPMLVGWLMPIRYLDLVRTMLPWVVP